MKNIFVFIILVSFLSCHKDEIVHGPQYYDKRGQVSIMVSYPKTCNDSLNWGKITISVENYSTSFILGVNPSQEFFQTLLPPGTHYFKVSLLSYCSRHPNFEETGSFIVETKKLVKIIVTIP